MAIDKETGEIINEPKEQPRAFASFLQMLEDGQFHAELSSELQDLNAEMNNHCINYGSRASGKVTISIDLKLDNGVFDIRSEYKFTKPKAPRVRSIAWSTPNNNFTPQNPRQQDMFKDVNARNFKNVS